MLIPYKLINKYYNSVLKTHYKEELEMKSQYIFNYKKGDK